MPVADLFLVLGHEASSLLPEWREQLKSITKPEATPRPRTSVRALMTACIASLSFAGLFATDFDFSEEPSISHSPVGSQQPTSSSSSATPHTSTLAPQHGRPGHLSGGPSKLSSASPADDPTLSGLERIANSPLVFGIEYMRNGRGELIATKVVRADFKYPFIRIQEKLHEAAAPATTAAQRAFMVADHVSLKLQPGVGPERLSELAEAQGYTVRKLYRGSSHALVSFPLEAADSLEAAKDYFERYPQEIAYVEVDYLRAPASIAPNDPNFHRQGYLSRVRTTEPSFSTVDNIGASQAWERRTDAVKENGDRVVIGVLDTGIYLEHEDLANNIWTNPNEIANNGIDDDGNGYIDDVVGWDFVADSNQQSPHGGHGTHVAGIIAAEGDNGVGVSGIAWNAALVSAQIYGAGAASGADIAEAIRYLVGLDVDLINGSFGGSGSMQAECDAIQEAHEAGILYFASAGNGSVDLDAEGVDYFPAECDVDNVVVVGAGSTREQDLEEGVSNYGESAVDIVAPLYAYSTYIWDENEPTGSYEYLEGTSQSTPMVTGAAALLVAEHPHLSHTEIKALLMSTATKAAPLEGLSQSGLLNLSRAINHDKATKVAGVAQVIASGDDGNVAGNAIDGDPNTRWSSLGDGESLTFELSEPSLLAALEIQWFKGDQRAAKFSIESSLDGITWDVLHGGLWQGESLEQSSGSSAELERYEVLNHDANYVRITGYGNTSNQWNSIREVVIHAYDDEAEEPTVELLAPSALAGHESEGAVELNWTDESTDEESYEILRRLSGGSWSSLASLAANSESYTDTSVSPGETYEYTVRANAGANLGPQATTVSVTLDDDNTPVGEPLFIGGVSASSHDGNGPSNTVDGSLSTRWSANGDGQWIDFSLEGEKTITEVNLAWYKGDQRAAHFTLSVQTAGGAWVELYSGTASGSTAGFETFTVGPVSGDTLRYTGFGNTSNSWNSVSEVQIIGY